MPSNKTTQANYRKQRNAELRAAGLCVQCGQESAGKYKCARCADKDKARRKQYAAKRKESGLCVNTGCKNPAKSGCVVCSDCSARASKSASARYYRHKDAGVCRYCGAESDGQARCESCAAYFKDYSDAWYDKVKAEGRCVECGKSHTATTVICDDCKPRRAENSKRRLNKLKLNALTTYSPGVIKCHDCDERDVRILEIDHVKGGGNQHRREIGQGNLYNWLKQNNYPAGFEVVCPTCNKKRYLTASDDCDKPAS